MTRLDLAASPRTALMESLHDNELQIEGYDLGDCTAADHGDDADAVLTSLASRGYRVSQQDDDDLAVAQVALAKLGLALDLWQPMKCGFGGGGCSWSSSAHDEGSLHPRHDYQPVPHGPRRYVLRAARLSAGGSSEARTVPVSRR